MREYVEAVRNREGPKRKKKTGGEEDHLAPPGKMEVYNPHVSLLDLPDEILLQIFSYLSTKDLRHTAHAIPATKEVLNSYNFIRIRELQCFCIKESFLKQKLGVGVSILANRRDGTFESEFDLLSEHAFRQFDIRTSI